MPDFHALSSSLTFSNTNVVVIGGTQSIGAGIAIRFAELGASVLIIGRNEINGNEMVKKLGNTSSDNGWDRENVRFGFARRDLGNVEEIKSAAQDIAGWAGKVGVQYLFQSQGGAPSGILTGTVEGVKGAFNVQILSHFLIPYLLMSLPEPVLGEDAQICNIARPGEINRNIDFDDFRSLKAIETGTFSILREVKKFAFMMDLFTQEFNVQFHGTHTTHVDPGPVISSGLDHPTVQWWVRMIFRVLEPIIACSPAQYADIVIWEIASEEARKMNRTFWDRYAREVVVDKRVNNDAQLRERVWEELLQLGEVI